MAEGGGKDGGSDGGKKRDALRLANLSSIGFMLVLCTFIGYGIGFYIDKFSHKAPLFTIIFLLLGIAAGFINVFKVLGDSSK